MGAEGASEEGLTDRCKLRVGIAECLYELDVFSEREQAVVQSGPVPTLPVCCHGRCWPVNEDCGV